MAQHAYCTVEQVKAAALNSGSSDDAKILRLIRSATQQIDQACNRSFLPTIATRYSDWPAIQSGRAWRLWLDDDLLAVTSLTVRAQDPTPLVIAAADYFLEPQRLGPPYTRIEMDRSSSSAFEPGQSGQRSIAIEGVWGYSQRTEQVGTVTSGLAADAEVTTFVPSDFTGFGTGDRLLIGSEQMMLTHGTSPLTVTRGEAGSTAAVHANGVAIYRYVVPADIQQLCLAETIAAFFQEQAGWGRNIGSDGGAVEFRASELRRLRKDVTDSYGRAREGAV